MVLTYATWLTRGTVNEILVESGHTGERRSFSSQLNGDSMRTDDHRVALAGYLEMMLDGLIKWRLPFSTKEAARKKCRSPRLIHGEWKAFELRYACDTHLGDRHCSPTSYLRATCNKYRHSSASFMFISSCAIVLFLINRILWSGCF